MNNQPKVDNEYDKKYNTTTNNNEHVNTNKIMTKDNDVDYDMPTNKIISNEEIMSSNVYDKSNDTVGALVTINDFDMRKLPIKFEGNSLCVGLMTKTDNFEKFEKYGTTTF